MSTCCKEATGQCCGGSEVSNVRETPAQAATTQKSDACCGDQAAH